MSKRTRKKSTSKKAVPEVMENSFNFSIDNCLGFIANRLVKCFMKVLDKELADHNLTGAQFCVLAKLFEEEGLTQTMLAQKLYIESPTLVRTLDKLEEAGFIERRRVPEDRRAFHIFLTPKGRQMSDLVTSIGSKVHSIAVEGLSEKEVADLKRFMYTLWKNLERAQEERS